MILINQKSNLKFYLKNNFFNKEDIINVLSKIIDEGFFLQKDRHFLNKDNTYCQWACDFRIPLLNSYNTKILFPYIAQYISDLNHTTIALKGYGAFPFISLSQYSNINKVLLIRKDKKPYGFQQEIEGIEINKIDVENNKNICLVDDICNAGNSMVTAKNILENNNYTVTNYFSIFNYKWGNKKINEDQFHFIIEVHK